MTLTDFPADAPADAPVNPTPDRRPLPPSPVLVLDSGLGGLTVVRALRRALPHENILYFGDTARVPYGNKSEATVTEFVRQIIAYVLTGLRCEPKHVVLACNTATALALRATREQFPQLSISGVIGPGARAAAAAAGIKPFPIIGVIATEATIRSKAYDRAIARRRQHARVISRPTPLLVPMAEEGRSAADPLVRLALQQYLKPLAQVGLDVLVLGCTHYPIYKDAIAAEVGPRVRVIDSAEQCAEDVARRLRDEGLLAATPSPSSPALASPRGSLRCYVSDPSPRFAALAGRFLGTAVRPPVWVPIEDLVAMEKPAEVWGV